MSKFMQTFVRSFFAAALMLFVLGGINVFAQTVVTGEWKANTKSEKSERAEKAGKIHLSFERRTERGGRNQMGQSYEYAELQGLSREQVLSGGNVRFSLVREAGTLECEGSFTNGAGAGTFRFTPNAQFVSAMKSRGFDFERVTPKGDRETEDRLFAAATLNVTTALADDLLSANFGRLDVDDLFKAAIFKVDSKYMREMKDSGFQNLTFEDLVKGRIFKIDAEYVRQVAAMGFANEPFESIVKMRIFKVTPEFISEIKSEGLQNLDIEGLVKMRIFKIDGAFIRQARSEGVPLEVEKLVQKRIGVYGK
jgi:hypothetical protein